MSDDLSGCLGGLGDLVGALVQRADRRPTGVSATEERWFAGNHWSLTAGPEQTWVLTNTGSVPATGISLTLRSDTRHGSKRRRTAIGLCDLFGATTRADRLRSTLPATSHTLLAPDKDTLEPGATLTIPLPASTGWDWVDVDWATLDSTTHWTKLTPPRLPATGPSAAG